MGLGEDGPDGLPSASRAALDRAEIIAGAPRHLALLPDVGAERLVWPVPFADGIAQLLAYRGRRVVMLASGDPFWFGAGSTVVRHLERGEWVALPVAGTFSLAASRLGWALEAVACLGLHAAPLERLRPHLAPRARALVLLRDGAALAALAGWLEGLGFGNTVLHVLERLGGPNERHRSTTAQGFGLSDVAHPVAVGLEVAGPGPVLPCAAGLPDDLFAHDGQITKRPIRALTMSALAPRAGELLWDIGAGAGSIGIEWLLAHPANRAIGFEADPTRAARARDNALALGVDRLQIALGRVPEALAGHPLPDVVFIGGGLSAALLDHLWSVLCPGTRVVANAVTLGSEALLGDAQARRGGTLMRAEISHAAPIGRHMGWRAAWPVMQWSVEI